MFTESYYEPGLHRPLEMELVKTENISAFTKLRKNRNTYTYVVCHLSRLYMCGAFIYKYLFKYECIHEYTFKF